MLVEDWRPKLYCKGAECQNLSPNGKVLFIEDDHKYFYESDVRSNGVIKTFEISQFKFRSPTGILSSFKEYFTDLEYKADFTLYTDVISYLKAMHPKFNHYMNQIDSSISDETYALLDNELNKSIVLKLT